MARRSSNVTGHRVQKSNGANLGFEEKLWQAASRYWLLQLLLLGGSTKIGR